MHVRLALLTVMLLSACRLSDDQQIGVLKFVASSITGAAVQAPATPVAQQKVKPAMHVRPCTDLAFHRLQHVHIRVQYAASRMQRAMSRLMHFERAALARSCAKRPATVRS